MTSEVECIDLGLIDYKEAWDLQERLFKNIIDYKIARRSDESLAVPKNYLIICEHPHVYTLGKSGKEDHLLLNDRELLQHDATYYKINRGGDITYHGPGQLVVYPIFDLDQFFTDIHKYMRYLEEAVIRTLEEFGIHSGRVDGLTGVWIDFQYPTARKICALGVKSSRWVTMHGIGFNINTNLNYFTHIVPCGIDDKAVTSMQNELGYALDFRKVSRVLIHHLKELFGFTLVEGNQSEIPS
jgi:lipoyl(octanoyl) transferase